MSPLDFLQFGIAPTVEVGTWISGYLRLRPLNTGLMSHLLLPADSEDSFVWGFGGTLGLHLFASRDGNQRGFYGGAALGYFYAETEDDRLDRAYYGTHALVPQIDLGYRWVWEHVLLGLGARVGLAVPVAWSDTPKGAAGCPTPTSCTHERNVLVPASIEANVGWLF